MLFLIFYPILYKYGYTQWIFVVWRQYLSSMQQRRRFLMTETFFFFSITNLLSTVYNKIFRSPWAFPKNFLSDCNTRQTSIKQAERNKSMTECICRPERRDISGSSIRDTLALDLNWNPAAVVFHSVICGQARFPQSTSTGAFVKSGF